MSSEKKISMPKLLLIVLLLPALGAIAEDREAGSMLATAEMAIEDGFHELAETRIKKAEVAADTRALRVDATLLRVKSALLQKNYKDAEAALAEVAKEAKTAGRETAAAFWTALVKRTKGGKSESKAVLQLLPDIPPDDPLSTPVRRLRARCLLDLEHVDKAYAELDAAASPPAWLDAAAIALRHADTNRAETVLRRLNALPDPPSLEQQRGRIWLSALLRESNRAPEAHRLLDRLESQAELPAELRRRALLERVELHSATNVVAAAEVLKTLEIMETDPATRAGLTVRRGRLLLDSDAYGDGAAMIQAALPLLRSDTEKSETLLTVGDHHLDAGRYKEADAAFDAHLQAFTNKVTRVLALRGKAWSVYKQARFPEAATMFNKVFNESQDRELKQEALFKIADAYFESGAFEKAAEAYRKFTRMVYDDPRQPQAIFQTGLSLVRAAKAREGRREFSHLVRLYPENKYAENALMKLAELDMGDANWPEAIANYEDYLETYTSGTYRVEALLNRSFCSYRLGDFSWALEGFTELAREHPEHPMAARAAYMRARTTFVKGDTPAARSLFESFLTTYPDSPYQEDTLFWLAERDYNRAKLKAAEDRFLSIATRFPEGRLFAQATFWAGRCAAEQKEYTRATEHYTSLIKARPESPRVPEALYNQGDALRVLGRFPDAINVFKQLVDEHPTSYLVPQTWTRIGDCQRALTGEGPARYRDAITSYQSASGAKNASIALKIEVGYRLGNLYKTLDQRGEAIKHFTDAAYLFLEHRSRLEPESAVWFTQSAYEAAKLLEQDKKYNQAEKLYRRIVAQGGAQAKEAEKRITRLTLERLIPFSN